MNRRTTPRPTGHVTFLGAGPGDPDLLTLKAARLIGAAEVILHDALIGPGILALAPYTARLVQTGKRGFAPSMPQARITALMLAEARQGRHVLRLKSGDPSIFGRLDEEIAALAAAGIAFDIVPGITAASAGAASLGQSLTARGRNSGLRILTGRDVGGLADQDWRGLSEPGAVAAIYMGKQATRFLQGRLMMFGADPATPVSVVENASLPGERIIAATLATLAHAAQGMSGPTIIFWGLAPRAARARLPRPAARKSRA